MEASRKALLIERTYTVELGLVQIYPLVGRFVQTFRSGGSSDSCQTQFREKGDSAPRTNSPVIPPDIESEITLWNSAAALVEWLQPEPISGESL